jgi:UDP-N-acetylglucosamine acyltransferase
LSARIDPRAVVDPSAEIADGVEIGPYAFVGPKAVLGEGTRVMHHGTVHGWTRLGKGNVVWSYASVGGDPQDYSYGGEEVWLEAGDRNVFREFVTVSRGTSKEQRVTRIGNDCLLMACAHVGHDCVLGNGVLLANNVLLAGHCHLDDRCILSGNVAVNHFTTVGRLAYVGGLSRIAMDVPPYMLVEGNPSRVAKVNIVGLQRAGFAEDRIKALRHAFRALWRSEELVRESVVARLEKDPASTEEVLHLAAFLRRQMAGKQGRAREVVRK